MKDLPDITLEFIAQDPKKALAIVMRKRLVRNGVPLEQITDEMVAQEIKEFDERMERLGTYFNRVSARISAMETPVAYAARQDANISYQAVLEKLFNALTIAKGEAVSTGQTNPRYIVGVNILEAAKAFELDAEECKQSLEKAGFTIDGRGLVIGHPSYKKPTFLKKLGSFFRK